MPPIGYDWRPDDRFGRPRPEGVEGMSAAEHGWPDVKPGDKSKYRTCRCGFRYQREQDLFDHVYRRALEDAADAVEDVRTNGLPIGTQSAPYGRHIEQWLRARAAAVAPRETKD